MPEPPARAPPEVFQTESIAPWGSAVAAGRALGARPPAVPEQAVEVQEVEAPAGVAPEVQAREEAYCQTQP